MMVRFEAVGMKPVVLVIRDPDYSNDIELYGVDAEIIDIDLGSDFNGPSDFYADSDWGREWIASVRMEVEHLDPDHPARVRIEQLITDLKGKERSVGASRSL
jgi:hypothetical protein